MEWNSTRVVVTGGASGIGFALAERAAAAGAIVAIVDLGIERATEAAARIAGAHAYAADVGDAAAVQALADRIAADLGGVDVVFANAGVAVGGKVEKLSPENAAWVASVNLLGPINTARSFLPLLRASAADGRAAAFVITGSEHSLGIPTIGASNMYTASKHAVLGVADVLRSDLEGSGVHVALLCPGLVATNIYDARSYRGAAFGGPVEISPEDRERVVAFMAKKGQDPALTAMLCFEGLDRGDFIIITDPHVGVFARKRLAEVEQALRVIEQRLPA